jgi:hypothetical protein
VCPILIGAEYPPDVASQLPLILVLLAALCETVTVVPAIVTVPVRVAPVVLALAVTVTVPGPVPLVGLTVRNPLPLAVHVAGVQPVGVTVTVIETLPPPLAIGPAVVGEGVMEHPADCDTLTD